MHASANIDEVETKERWIVGSVIMVVTLVVDIILRVECVPNSWRWAEALGWYLMTNYFVSAQFCL